ncbi:hypothetical protein Glove_232g89 [Diversispora epigaea]|uniref:Uncharacterized protein n=1 Tax=Diversispora epigaea TaxID=1348612 RepID=A0A397IC25_9GLOM|nr:hypothetical protein Glove_232g89 [Diversispora epigaea]
MDNTRMVEHWNAGKYWNTGILEYSTIWNNGQHGMQEYMDNTETLEHWTTIDDTRTLENTGRSGTMNNTRKLEYVDNTGTLEHRTTLGILDNNRNTGTLEYWKY